eukprot:CAMPEP_0197896568 /NCGR_PEP_ID=MMETSP1439-20131203/40218_1 /TAXON_ID=66791 /ORGANISM="Gonyaulax spinifera, Strain CCMP409" /LENGTH=286 /DNA_ID=CAMNT_0043517111 /DNA_START=34 /DNA_END=893 /DNA_ORIENTATION=-
MEGCARLPMLANSGRSTSSTGSACPWAASSTGSDAARDDGGQAPEFVPGPLRQDVSMQSLCNSFLEAQCLHESVGAIPDPWAGGESTASFRDIYGVFAPPTDQTIHVAVLPFTPAQAAAWAGYPLETNSMVLTICMAPTVVTPPLAQAEDTSPPPQSPEMTETTEAAAEHAGQKTPEAAHQGLHPDQALQPSQRAGERLAAELPGLPREPAIRPAGADASVLPHAPQQLLRPILPDSRRPAFLPGVPLGCGHADGPRVGMTGRPCAQMESAASQVHFSIVSPAFQD